MPAATLYPSVLVPGLTVKPAHERRLPSVLDILQTTEPMSDDRAKRLGELAKCWYDAARPFHREAAECAAHDAGAQWGLWQGDNWIENPLTAEADQIRIVCNLTRPIIDQATSMLTQDAPIFRCAAATSEGSDGAAAMAARELLDYFWRYHDLDQAYRSTGRGAYATGTSFVLVEWDKTRGYPVPTGRAKSPSPESIAVPEGVDATGALLPPDAPLTPVRAPHGDLRYRMPMREQVAFDPAARLPGGQDGIGVFVTWKESRARLLELFPDRYEELPEPGVDKEVYAQEDRATRYSAATGQSLDSTDEKAETYDVRVLYLRARENRPRGDMLVFVDGKMLLEGENDIYPTAEELAGGELWPAENWPLFTLYADPREGCPWGRARTVDLIPLQHVSLIANAKLALPSGLDFEPTDEPGQIIRYARAFGPGSIYYLAPPQMPQEYMVFADWIRGQMENVAGVNAASMGQSPTSDASGRLSQSLQQRDTTRIAPIKRGLDNAWGRIQTFALRLFRKYAEGERAVIVLGENQSVSLKHFNRASLAAGTDIIVLNDSSLPRDPQARILALQNVAMMIANVKDPELAKLLLSLLRLPDLEEFERKKDPHGCRARDVVQMLILGAPPEQSVPPPMDPPQMFPPGTPLPLPWDNPLIHKAALEEFGCSLEFANKVAAEKVELGGQSPLEQRVVALWSYHAQRAMPPAPAPMGAGPGAPVLPGPGAQPQPGPSAPPTAQKAA